MLMFQRLLDIVDLRVWHTTAFQHFQPLVRRLCRSDFFNQSFQLVAVFDAVSIGDELRIALPLRLAEFVAQDTEKPVVATTEHHIAIFGVEAFVRNDGGVCRSPAACVRFARDQD